MAVNDAKLTVFAYLGAEWSPCAQLVLEDQPTACRNRSTSCTPAANAWVRSTCEGR